MTSTTVICYRRGYSTETTLLKAHSDNAESLDEGSMNALTVLDLSSAFDVIDHPILLWNDEKGKATDVALHFCVSQESVFAHYFVDVYKTSSLNY